MYRIFCRIYQRIMKIAMRLLPWKTPEILEGPGSLSQLPALIQNEGFSHVLLVTGDALWKQGRLDEFFHQLEELHISYTLFHGIPSDPTQREVEIGVRLFTENSCQALIAIGGGSPMDCCKAIAASVVKKRKTISQLQGLFRIRKRIPVIFAVPTTAGTGSETTIAAVITDTATGRKASITDSCLMPHFAILDPLLTESLPPRQTAYSGMDALCHAVEAYTNSLYNSPLEDHLAEEAVLLIYQNLYQAYTDGSDLQARQNMQKAAFYAGRAFTRGCVGYVHAIGHGLGSLYGIPHGLAMAVILPHVLRQYGSAVYEKLAQLAGICGMNGADKGFRDKENTQKLAESFITWIDRLNQKMGIPSGFAEIREEDMPQIISWALKEANPLYPVPVIWDAEDMERCLRSLCLESDAKRTAE